MSEDDQWKKDAQSEPPPGPQDARWLQLTSVPGSIHKQKFLSASLQSDYGFICGRWPVEQHCIQDRPQTVETARHVNSYTTSLHYTHARPPNFSLPDDNPGRNAQGSMVNCWWPAQAEAQCHDMQGNSDTASPFMQQDNVYEYDAVGHPSMHASFAICQCHRHKSMGAQTRIADAAAAPLHFASMPSNTGMHFPSHGSSILMESISHPHAVSTISASKSGGAMYSMLQENASFPMNANAEQNPQPMRVIPTASFNSYCNGASHIFQRAPMNIFAPLPTQARWPPTSSQHDLGLEKLASGHRECANLYNIEAENTAAHAAVPIQCHAESERRPLHMSMASSTEEMQVMSRGEFGKRSGRDMDTRSKIKWTVGAHHTGKDRHSKVKTSKGIRDRRVRLSVSTALQFYDIQDRLGFQQPSHVFEWLMQKAEYAINQLPTANATQHPDSPKAHASGMQVDIGAQPPPACMISTDDSTYTVETTATICMQKQR